jgi:hypothetical protein
MCESGHAPGFPQMRRIKRHADFHRLVPRESACMQSALSAGNCVSEPIHLSENTLRNIRTIEIYKKSESHPGQPQVSNYLLVMYIH